MGFLLDPIGNLSAHCRRVLLLCSIPLVASAYSELTINPASSSESLQA